MTNTPDIAASLAGRKLGKHDLLVVLCTGEPSGIPREQEAERIATEAGCGLILLMSNGAGVSVIGAADQAQLRQRGVDIRVNQGKGHVEETVAQ